MEESGGERNLTRFQLVSVFWSETLQSTNPTELIISDQNFHLLIVNQIWHKTFEGIRLHLLKTFPQSDWEETQRFRGLKRK